MSLAGGGKNNETNQYHWNSWGKYILSQPQVQQQQTQNPRLIPTMACCFHDDSTNNGKKR
jgi:hypothetical protein